MPYFSFLSSIFAAFRTPSAASEGSSQTAASTTSSPAPSSASQTALSNAAKRTRRNPFPHVPVIKCARLDVSAAFNLTANDTTYPIFGNVLDHSSDSSGIRNIPAPDTTTFGAPKATAPTQTETPEVEITDAIESNSPPPYTRSSSSTPLNADNEVSPSRTATNLSTAFSDNSEIPIHTKFNTRPILHPIPQKNRLSTHSKRDILSEITAEVEDGSGTLPGGYIGTWKGMRLYELDYGSPGCGAGRHELVCRHFVECGKREEGRWEPCGINCIKPKFSAAPYNCPQCLAAVKNAIHNQLTELEKNKLEEAKKAEASNYVIGYMVEYAIKYTKLTGNITEAVQTLLDPSFGRKCETCSPPPPLRRQTAEDIVRGLYERRDRKAWEKKNEGKKGSKRKEAPTFEREAENKKMSNENNQEDDAGAHEQLRYAYHKATTYDELYHAKRRRLSPPSLVEFATTAFHIPPVNTIRALVRKRALPLEKTVEFREDKDGKIIEAGKRRKSGRGVGDRDNKPQW